MVWVSAWCLASISRFLGAGVSWASVDGALLLLLGSAFRGCRGTHDESRCRWNPMPLNFVMSWPWYLKMPLPGKPSTYWCFVGYKGIESLYNPYIAFPFFQTKPQLHVSEDSSINFMLVNAIPPSYFPSARTFL